MTRSFLLIEVIWLDITPRLGKRKYQSDILRIKFDRVESVNLHTFANKGIFFLKRRTRSIIICACRVN